MGYIKPEITEYKDNVHLFRFEDGRELYLVGTAHVSASSVALVEDMIHEVDPDTICVELDEQRYESIQNPNKFQNLNIIEIIKKKQTFFLIGQLVLSAFQKKVSEKTGSKPGREFIRAIDLAQERTSTLELVDRNIGVTLKRAWRLNTLWGKVKIIGSLMMGSSGKGGDVEAEDIEALKSMDALTDMIKEMGKEMPKVKQALIDERDLFLGGNIQNKLGQKTVAVVGAGHVPGILELFERRVDEAELDAINVVPPKTTFGKMLPWLIPAIILALFAWGFTQAGWDKSQEAMIYWVLVNGILSALGALAAFGHPITVLTAFVAAPITSLNPTIGAGMVAGLVQAFVKPPKVKDLEMLQTDAGQPKKWWSNLFLRLLLVVLLSSLGSAIGTFVALPMIFSILG